MIRQLNLGVTASIGVASLRRGESRKSVLERVDSSMYLAKQQGGNRVLQFPEKSMFPGNEDL
jgi:PleD family two-component response regulator